MIIRACAFTSEGWILLERLAEAVKENRVTEKTALGDYFIEKKEAGETLEPWLAESFSFRLPILFVGAMGIAVRKIAPFVQDKLTDSPVLVMDEKGQFVIPILSNHVGGGNEIAANLAKLLGSQCVLTTATDVNGLFAVDVFARRNGLQIVNREGIQKVSGKLLKGEHIRMAVHPDIELNRKQMPDCIELVSYEKDCMAHNANENSKQGSDLNIDVCIDLPTKLPQGEKKANESLSAFPLKLLFKPYILGLGCKKAIAFDALNALVTEVLKDKQMDESLVAGIASIDLKKEEKGLLYLAAKKGVPFITFTAEELQKVEGDYCDSSFVEQVAGVANVCERAAMCLAGEGATLVVPKIAKDGMTIAISRRKARIEQWET